MKVQVNMWDDEHDCETCGFSFATGGEVYIDGELVISRPPRAYCFDCDNTEAEDLIILALKEVGIEVSIDWEYD